LKKHTFSFIVIALTLLSCSGSKGQFRLKGSFAHLEQGEFFIYSNDGGLDCIDTLRILNGKFDYTTPLEGEATYHILYPNFSELVIFGQSGKVVKIKGDAHHLNGVEVKGDKENETYTNFRKEAEQKSPRDVIDIARKFIYQHPTLTMSRHLFQQYFLQSEETTREEMMEVFDSLNRALPSDIRLARLYDEVRSKGVLQVGKKFPHFDLTIRPSLFPKQMNNGNLSRKKKDEADSLIVNPDTLTGHVGSKDYEGKYMLIAFWATWKSGSQSALYRARRIRKESLGKIHPLSYSLDVEEEPLKKLEKSDSVTFPSFCDYLCWRSPLVREIGLRELPFFVLLDKDQKILALGKDWSKDIEPATKEIILDTCSSKSLVPPSKVSTPVPSQSK